MRGKGRTTVAEMVKRMVRAGLRDDRILATVTNHFPRSRMTRARILTARQKWGSPATR